MNDKQSRQAELQSRYDAFVAAGLKLDLTRGKPCAEQLDLSNALDGILDGFYLLQDGTDVRNYGGILGIPEARSLGAGILETGAENVLVGGNSSLNLMYHYVNFQLPCWRNEAEKIRFLCPVPGYDRHFTICEHFDIDMINIPMDANGPDMEAIRNLVREDPAIKGIWCVPKYSNPTGQSYSAEVVQQFATLAREAGDGFTVFWDNAYVVHDLEEPGDKVASLLGLAKQAGTEDSVVMFASTSKITFAGAGVSFLATSTANLKNFEQYLSNQMIGFDKVNQLRHVRFLEDNEGIKRHMAKHRAIIKPRFDLVLQKLDEHLGGKNIATWTAPRGGYFVSLDTLPGLASTIVNMALGAGVKLTPAGATYPYGRDPNDTNIRIAPTYPGLGELETAMDVLVTCVELASLNADPG